MLWLIWHMWILIALAFFGGVIAGWVIRARSDEAPERPLLETIEATAVVPASEVAEPAPAEPRSETRPEDQSEPGGAPEADADAPAEAAVEAESEPVADAAIGQSSEAVPEDDLTAIKGLGPKAAEKLKAEGVTRLDQIAAWTKADIERFDALINGRGRIARDGWVAQAKALAKG